VPPTPEIRPWFYRRLEVVFLILRRRRIGSETYKSGAARCGAAAKMSGRHLAAFGFLGISDVISQNKWYIQIQ
jgi:hypothetical protein